MSSRVGNKANYGMLKGMIKALLGMPHHKNVIPVSQHWECFVRISYQRHNIGEFVLEGLSADYDSEMFFFGLLKCAFKSYSLISA